jgi:hypothetical protein
MPLPIIAAGIARAGAGIARAGAAGAARLTGRGGAKIKIDATKAVKKLEKMTDFPDDIIEKGYEVFYEETPVDKGNARRNTKLNKRKGKIQANYPYAKRLDEGYSKQSPQGMSKPARKAMGKYADEIVIELNKE